MPYQFDSNVIDMGPFQTDWPQDTIKYEPMFFNSDLEFAEDRGGPITKAFINALPREWQDSPCVLDSRVHMLMPGWYPAIPGYHHDDVPRPAIPVGSHFLGAGQPDYENPRYYSQHIMGLVNGHICPTAFALGKCLMPKMAPGELIYRAWHQEVEQLLKSGVLTPFSAPSGRLLWFDWQTFHTGVKASAGGWRWFCRVSRDTDRVKSITNEIRTQVQVYLEFPMEGW